MGNSLTGQITTEVFPALFDPELVADTSTHTDSFMGSTPIPTSEGPTSDDPWNDSITIELEETTPTISPDELNSANEILKALLKGEKIDIDMDNLPGSNAMAQVLVNTTEEFLNLQNDVLQDVTRQLNIYLSATSYLHQGLGSVLYLVNEPPVDENSSEAGQGVGTADPNELTGQLPQPQIVIDGNGNTSDVLIPDELMVFFVTTDKIRKFPDLNPSSGELVDYLIGTDSPSATLMKGQTEVDFSMLGEVVEADANNVPANESASSIYELRQDVAQLFINKNKSIVLDYLTKLKNHMDTQIWTIRAILKEVDAQIESNQLEIEEAKEIAAQLK